MDIKVKIGNVVNTIPETRKEDWIKPQPVVKPQLQLFIDFHHQVSASSSAQTESLPSVTFQLVCFGSVSPQRPRYEVSCFGMDLSLLL